MLALVCTLFILAFQALFVAAAAPTAYGCQMTVHHPKTIAKYNTDPRDTVPFSWVLSYVPASCYGLALPMIMNVNPSTSSASVIKCGAANSSTANTGTWTIPTTDTTTTSTVTTLMYCNIQRNLLSTTATYNLASKIANQNTTTTSVNFQVTHTYTAVASDAPQRRRKRAIDAGHAPQDFRCSQAGFIACQKVGAPKGTWECIEDNKVDNCGGCPHSEDAVDCTEIAGADNISCRVGQCDITSCLPGYLLINKVCVPALTRGSARSSSTRQRQRFNGNVAKRQIRQPLQPAVERPTPVLRA